MNITITNHGTKGSGIYIGRPTIYGNPFPVKKSKYSDDVYSLRESLFLYHMEYLPTINKDVLYDLYLKFDDLVLDCFCVYGKITLIKRNPDFIRMKCHGQVLVHYIWSEFGPKS